MKNFSQIKTSDLLIEALENEGVEYIFGLPGEENIDFLESLRKSNKITFVLVRHEQGAGFMAATYGRLTGKPGVCLSTLGPGALNLMTPAAYAQLGAMPLVMLTGQKPIKKSQQGKFQIIDVVDAMRPLTKFTKQVTHGEHIPSLVRESFRLSMEERPGAVHLEIPEDIAEEMVENARTFVVDNYRIPHADKESVAMAAKLIAQAKNPLILIGAGANRKRASKALTELIEALEIPFFNTQMGKGVVDERSPQYIGTAALSSNDFIHEAIDRADLILNVGHDSIEKPPFFMKSGDERKVIHLNFFPAEIDEVYFPDCSVIGDIASSIHVLKELLEKYENHWDFSFYKKVKENVQDHLSKYFADNRFPILPQRLVKITRDLLEEDDIVTLDNGMYKIWYARNYPVYTQNSLILDNALATMGAGLASAMTAKMLNPDKTVVSINGDGGFLMNSQELETAQRLKLDLIVIILNDQGYGMIKWKQEGMGFDSFGLDYENPDFIKYAESFGATGHRPQSVEEFETVFHDCKKARGIQLIDLSIDYSLNHKILNELITEYTKNLKN